MAKTPADGPVAEARAASVVPKDDDFFIVASRSTALAQRLLPLLNRFILAMASIAMLAMIISLVSVYSHPNPQVLLSFPDGATRCAQPPLDPQTRQPKPRPASEADVCAQLGDTLEVAP